MDPSEPIHSPIFDTDSLQEFAGVSAWMLDRLPLGIFLFQDHRFVYVNGRSADILGRGVEELRALHTLEPLIFPPDYAALNDWFTRLFAGEAERELQLFRVVRPDTTLRRTLGTATRVSFKGIPSILGSLVDVTDWLESFHRNERLRRLGTVGCVADALGNDLNNLLSSILGNAALLREGPLAQGFAAESLLEIETGALQSADLVSRLLNTSASRPLLQRAMNLNDAINRAVSVLRSTTARHVELRTRTCSDPRPVQGDPALVEQIVLQLGANACEAMPTGGILKIETSEVVLDSEFCRTHPEVEPGQHIRLRIEDTGRGIPPEFIDQVFDPFFTTKHQMRGAGVGLTLCHNLVTAHGGCIDLRSWLGQGTCVDIYFPVAEPVVAASAAPANLHESVGQAMVLVIDDDELARSTASRILQRHGYRVIEAGRGEEGLSILDVSRPSIKVVLLDLIMPGLSGRQTLEKIREKDPNLPVVLISGHSVEIIDSAFERLNVQYLVKKPYRPVDLVQAIAAALGGPGDNGSPASSPESEPVP